MLGISGEIKLSCGIILRLIRRLRVLIHTCQRKIINKILNYVKKYWKFIFDCDIINFDWFFCKDAMDLDCCYSKQQTIIILLCRFIFEEACI